MQRKRTFFVLMCRSMVADHYGLATVLGGVGIVEVEAEVAISRGDRDC